MPSCSFPPGLVQSAPGRAYFFQSGEVDWRVRAEQPGTYDISRAPCREVIFSKRVVAGSGLTRIVFERGTGKCLAAAH